MKFSELSTYEKQLVRAGYYKLNKRVLDDRHAESLDSDQINFYTSTRKKAIRREELWSNLWSWGIGIAIFIFFGFLIFNPNNESDASNASSTSSSEQTQDEDMDFEETEYTHEPEYDLAPSSTEIDEYEQPEQSSGCNQNYSGCVPDSPYDLDCADIGTTVQVLGYDEYNLDRDGDGFGCESY